MKQFEQGEAAIVLGLMSGTSLDGIDAALLETNGLDVVDVGPFLSLPYDNEFRIRLKAAVETAAKADASNTDAVLLRDITDRHITAVQRLLGDEATRGKWASPSLIGFHGHTTLHRPERSFTQQIGDPARLANALRIAVVSDLRIRDVEAGGQGAPLVPIYHAALCRPLEKPVCVVNIGGISNITWIGPDQNDLIAFDTGTGNGLLDAWMEQETGKRFDEDGDLAATGRVNEKVLKQLLTHPYFELRYPKSLDRSDFSLDILAGLSAEDGAATLVSFTALSIVRGLYQCPSPSRALYVSGGGRHNKTMMTALQDACPCTVYPIETLGWNGDAIEAQAFAYLAARSCANLPITFPGTTGAVKPMTGGKLTTPT